jgi:hypothetical protein
LRERHVGHLGDVDRDIYAIINSKPKEAIKVEDDPEYYTHVMGDEDIPNEEPHNDTADYLGLLTYKEEMADAVM